MWRYEARCLADSAARIKNKGYAPMKSLRRGLVVVSVYGTIGLFRRLGVFPRARRRSVPRVRQRSRNALHGLSFRLVPHPLGTK